MKRALEKTLFKSGETVISIRADGTILADGFNPAVNNLKFADIRSACAKYAAENGRLFVPTDAAAGTETFFVISETGDVIQFGQNSDTGSYGRICVEDWTEITRIVASRHAVGLRKDGTVVASGCNSYGQCDVSGWTGIRKIACNLFVTAGIRNDGCVVVCGETSSWKGDVNAWKNICDIYCCDEYLLGVDGDGNVFYCGEEKAFSAEICGWKNVEKIIGSDDNVAALTKDGSVLVAGYDALKSGADAWKDIVDIQFSTYLLIALDRSGSVSVAGDQTVNHFSGFERQIWKNWSGILKIVPALSGFLALGKDGNVKPCLPDAWDFRQEALPEARKWKCFTSLETIEQDYTGGFARFKAQMTSQAEASRKRAEKEDAKPYSTGTWLAKTVQNAKTDPERLSAMGKICAKIKKERATTRVPSLIFKLLFLINTLAAFWGFGSQFASPEEKIAIAALPGGVKTVLSILEPIFGVFYGAINGLLGLFQLKLPAETVQIISGAVACFLLICVLPTLISRLIRWIIWKRPEGTYDTSKWSSLKLAARETYGRLQMHSGKGFARYGTWLPSLIASAGIIMLCLFITEYPDLFQGKNSLMLLLAGVPGCFLVLQLIILVPKLIARAKAGRKTALRRSDVETFENFWAEFDAEKRAEVEARRAAERAARARREQEALRARTAERSGGSDSSSAGSQATLIIDARGAHSANEFTVYVDGDRVCKVDGGNKKQISVSAGRHVIQVQVYNDAAESAYVLDPVEEYFDANQEYTLEYN